MYKSACLSYIDNIGLVTLKSQHGSSKKINRNAKKICRAIGSIGGPDGPLSKSEAAEQAGYSPKRARVEGSQLTNPRHATTCSTIHR